MLCFTKFTAAKKFKDERGRGSIKIFLRNILVPQCRKVSQEKPFSPQYKFFDQHLQTVEIETTV